MSGRWEWFVVFAALQACGGGGGGGGDFTDCTDVDISAAELLPPVLSETGLYSNLPDDVLADDVLFFEPRFPLWTDSASKRRWLLLPAGGQVDTNDPDRWVFPVGTRLFKEFTRDGVRVETRMSIRQEDGWTAVSYIWDEDGADASLAIAGETNASETPHDVPDAAQCLACHGGRANFVLGFAAAQFDVSTREALFVDGVLSDPVDAEPALDDTSLSALGYLHANCSHCHNEGRDVAPQATDCFDPNNPLDFTLPVGLASLEGAPAMQTAEEELDDEVLERMSQRSPQQMPPLGTELVDPVGLATVRAFVESL